MIACVSPYMHHVQESKFTLSYAAGVMNIKNEPVINIDPKSLEIERLREQLDFWMEKACQLEISPEADEVCHVSFSFFPHSLLALVRVYSLCVVLPQRIDKLLAEIDMRKLELEKEKASKFVLSFCPTPSSPPVPSITVATLVCV